MLTTGYHMFLRGPAADGISALHPSDYADRFHTFAMYEVLQLPQPPSQPLRRSTALTDFGGRLWVPYYLLCCGCSCLGASGEESLTLLDGRKARAAWLILPYSRFLKIWLAIIGPLIVYNVIWVPLEVSQMASAGTVHGQIDFILDFFFYIDMVIIFRTAFVDRDNEIVLDGKVIAKRYVFKGSFVIDLIATLQWETIFTGQTAFSNTGSNDDGQASATRVVARPPLAAHGQGYEARSRMPKPRKAPRWRRAGRARCTAFAKFPS